MKSVFVLCLICGGAAHIEEKLLAVPAETQSVRLYTTEYLASLGKIQLRKLARKAGIAASNNLDELRTALGALEDPQQTASSSSAPAAKADRQYSDEFLATQGQIQLRKLARKHGVDTGGGAAKIRERLALLTEEKSAPDSAGSGTPQPDDRLFTEEHLASLGQIQLRKLARQNDLDTKGGPSALRKRLGELRKPASEPASEQASAPESQASDSDSANSGSESDDAREEIFLKLDQALSSTSSIRCKTTSGSLQVSFCGGEPVPADRVWHTALIGGRRCSHNNRLSASCDLTNKIGCHWWSGRVQYCRAGLCKSATCCGSSPTRDHHGTLLIAGASDCNCAPSWARSW